uniref:Heterogeneous nuclear ribonucleoprotein Q acidic domain-containing protein n=1 Tax=Sinocyclocheilus anshuiensis TaxID=1608454 RepID=A0A671SV75_9TELE
INTLLPNNVYNTNNDNIYELDERALEALKEFNEEGALQVLVQFKESDLSHVQVSVLALTKVPFSTLLERTGYTLDVTTGQRKYGGPPPESVYTGAQPTVGTELIHIRTRLELRLTPEEEKAGGLSRRAYACLQAVVSRYIDPGSS